MITLSTCSSDTQPHTVAVDVYVDPKVDLCVLVGIQTPMPCGNDMKGRPRSDVGVGDLVLGQDIVICSDTDDRGTRLTET